MKPSELAEEYAKDRRDHTPYYWSKDSSMEHEIKLGFESGYHAAISQCLEIVDVSWNETKSSEVAAMCMKIKNRISLLEEEK